MRSFYIRRLQFSSLLTSHSAMNLSRYLRLMLLSIMDISLTLPLAVYSLYISNKGVRLAPWISWSDTHFDFGRVNLIPTAIWSSDPSYKTSVELTNWLPILCAFLFFALFGFAHEARKQYSRVFSWIAARLGFKLSSSPTGNANLSRYGYPSLFMFSQLTFPISSLKRVFGSTLPVAPEGALPNYTPKFAASKKDAGCSTTFASDDHELDSYTKYDVEKSAGLSPTSSAPPQYYSSDYEDLSPTSEVGPSSHPSLRLSTLSLDSQPDTHSLHTENSRAPTYVSESYHESSIVFPRSPSPAPFADLVATPSLNPFTPIHHPRSLEAIRVTVYTHSESTDAL